MYQNVFILLTGASGTGKSTVANELYKRYGLSQIYSYTTRPQRGPEDREHVFITNEQFQNLQQLVGYTKYNGYYYGATQEQVEENDIYVIDIHGIEYFLGRYQGDKEIIIVGLTLAANKRLSRMVLRDGKEKATQRLEYDEYIEYQKNVVRYADFVIENDNIDTTVQLIYEYLHYVTAE